MNIDIQRLRNLTTGRLHTKMDHIYEDLEAVIGDEGLMTHMLPRVLKAIEPWLRDKITERRFWDGEYDPTHTGEIDLPEPTAGDRDAMLARYRAMPNPIEGKDGLVVYV